MKYSIKEIEYYVREALGYGKLEGLYIAEEAVMGDSDPADHEIITGFVPEPSFISYPDWDEDFQIYMGMTKLVIVPRKRNYVIKIPFTGFYSCTYDEDGFETDFKPVGEATQDVCQIEDDFYENASDELQQILTPNFFIMNIDGLSIYIQEKYSTTYENSKYSFDIDYVKTISPIKNKIINHVTNKRLGKSFVGALIETFGITKAAKVVYETEYIDDLHRGNYGFAKDGRCMIFDYAGYNSNFYEYFQEGEEYCE